MGTRQRFRAWVPYQGLGTPSFLPPFRDGNPIGHAPGGRDSEPQFELRCGGSFHQFGVPFGKETGAVVLRGPDFSGMAGAVGWPYARTSGPSVTLSPPRPESLRSQRQRPFEARYMSEVLGLLVLGEGSQQPFGGGNTLRGCLSDPLRDIRTGIRHQLTR
jgi:hypothetical protein